MGELDLLVMPAARSPGGAPEPDRAQGARVDLESTPSRRSALLQRFALSLSRESPARPSGGAGGCRAIARTLGGRSIVGAWGALLAPQVWSSSSSRWSPCASRTRRRAGRSVSERAVRGSARSSASGPVAQAWCMVSASIPTGSRSCANAWAGSPPASASTTTRRRWPHPWPHPLPHLQPHSAGQNRFDTRTCVDPWPASPAGRPRFGTS
jgi:hypothetical protein